MTEVSNKSNKPNGCIEFAKIRNKIFNNEVRFLTIMELLISELSAMVIKPRS